MSLAARVIKNTITQISGKAISIALGLVIVALFTRYLGTEGYGQYTEIITFLTFFGIIVDFGLTLTTVQMISEPGAPQEKILNNLFTLRLISAVLFFALAPVVVLFTPYPPIVKIGVLITTAAFLLTSLDQVFVGLFQKELAMRSVAIAENAGRIVMLVLAIVIIALDAGLLALMGVLTIGNLVHFIILFFYSRRFVRIRFCFDREIWRDIVNRSWPLGLSIIFNLIYLRADVLLLSLIRTESEVGLYGAAYRLLDIAIMIPTMIMGLVLPLLTHAWMSGAHDTFRSRLQRTFDATMIIAVPLFLGGLATAGPLMIFIAGPEFLLAGRPLQILLVALFATFVSTIFGHAIVALRRQRQALWIYGIDALLSLIAYLIFIPRYGMSGAAWVTVFSEVFAMIALAIMTVRISQFRLRLGVTGRAVLASVIMSTVIFLAREYHVVVTIIIGALVYGAAIVAIGGVSRATLREVFAAPPPPEKL